MPLTRPAISWSLRIPPSRLRRMSSAGDSGGNGAVIGAEGAERLRAERKGEQLAERDGDAHALRPGEVDRRIRPRELGELLAAPAAGRAELGTLGHDDGLD